MAAASASISASASASSSPKMEKLSFAKIAAAGLKPTSKNTVPGTSTAKAGTQNPEQENSHNGIAIVTTTNEDDQVCNVPKPKRLVQLASQDAKESVSINSNGAQFLTHKGDPSCRRADDLTSDTLSLPNPPDDVGTQMSSESGSFKPPSLDGKSFASATTFALDEKESLRPDDSASVKAVEDEELFSPPGSGLPGSRIGSDDGVRAFRDQLQEISSMDSIRRNAAPQMVGTVPKGVLYIPPQGPGVGSIPNIVHASVQPVVNIDIPPDPKLLEALDSPRDRIWVLKLEQDIIDFVKDAKESSLNLPQCNSFYRMLAHKIADYYMLGHMVDDSSAAVRLFKTPNCRIPPPLTGITTPSTAASTPPPTAPQMKILRRGIDSNRPAIANGSNLPSKSTSENSDSGNEDDKKPKLPATREEREARYEAARLRIMGSAKPSDSPEAPKDVHESRSSSVAGKKLRKKARADSDDDFDSRSAYSNYFTTPYNPDALSPGPYGYSDFVQSPGSQFSSRPYDQSQLQNMQHMPLQAPNTGAWPHQPYHASEPAFTWPSHQQSPYELASDFRAMTFQNQVPSPSQPHFYSQYGSQYYGPQQMLQQPPYQSTSAPPPNHGQGFPPPFPQSPRHAGNMTQDPPPYAFGQLPSQAYPGRPASKMEHPLPGSYKGKHFNPQSQAFVPGNASANNSRPFTPQGLPTNNPYFASAFGSAGQLQHQSSASSSPHQPSSPSVPSRMQTQPLTHPLPQPVFPRQPSPNMPLPPKPGQNVVGSNVQQVSSQMGPVQTHQDQSVIAKWGTPASLPAKPPPSTEPFDTSRLNQTSRPLFSGGATRPINGTPSLSAAPPQPGVAIVNGAGQAVRR